MQSSAVRSLPLEDVRPATGPRPWGLGARCVALLLRAAVRVFFRRIEIVGAEKIPDDRPLVLVANHVNGIVDPLLVGLLRRQARFLAKSTLWSHPVIRPLLALTEAIPVYRHQDEGADTSRNADSFARCHAALARGEVLALFPEGKSHNAAELAPLRTGAARIVLEAEATHGPLGIRIVPVGLTFDAKGLFRSRALVRVGEPIDPAAERQLATLDPRAAVRRLTERIAAALGAVTLNYPSWEEARLIERAADLYAQQTTALPLVAPLADRFAVRQAFADGYRRLVASEPERVHALARAVARYDGLLRTLGLRDEQVAARYPVRAVGRALGRGAVVLLGWLPLAALGMVSNWIPYRGIGAAARRLGREADVVATYKLLGGVLVFPLWWLLGAVAAVWACGSWSGLAAAPIAAVSGFAALRFDERRAHLWDEARALALLRTRAVLSRELERRRARLAAELGALVDAYQRTAS